MSTAVEPEAIVIDDSERVQRLFVGAKFETLEAAKLMAEKYEEESGFRLKIVHSSKIRVRFACAQHLDCPFMVNVGRRRKHGDYVFKTVVTNHTAKERGARPRKRRRGLPEIVREVARTKPGPVLPADVMKATAAANGEPVPYMVAYRAIKTASKDEDEKRAKSFQRIIPYLKMLSSENPNSRIDYEVDSEKRLLRVFFCLGFVNEALKSMRPLISLDACELNGKWKGTAYVGTARAATNEVYPLAFAIMAGQEDASNWAWFLGNLGQGCPQLLTMERRFVFVSNHDGGKAHAMNEIFPECLHTVCAAHLKSKIDAAYGREVGSKIVQLARTFSLSEAQVIWDEIDELSPEAVEYLKSIAPEQWLSSEWVHDSSLPPRFGMICSNAKEATSSWIDHARNRTWEQVLLEIQNNICFRFGNSRKKYRAREAGGIVPDILRAARDAWDEGASMSVIETNEGRFQVSESQGFSEHIQGIMNIVAPAQATCTCGKWQDRWFPCEHGCAYFKHIRRAAHVNPFVHSLYQFSSVRETFKVNVNPVVPSMVQYDRETRPPPA
eukprot:CAMPEP_0113970342 /NCGR_PEP_ID=MMETSP0011_2-20120614/11078_1 /TAXON_ID=101924 /ORGANISM="Rhodosorus marinus" /LENGTH=553 /DNA_ID=CAMNT_0000984617 /DNA_START=65 /DNA_END=1726 /DNA_ORIENTATION=+ /assembly_acc=CAM_ASM_000156